jgi:hydrogenase maturation protein HypF
MKRVLARVSVRGVVQGVGFRPFVYQLARVHGLGGWVRNTSGDVQIEVEGNEEAVEHFLTELKSKAPPMARIEALTHTYHPPAGNPKFEIRPSSSEEGKYQLVSPDISTCRPCLGEILDPADRRYRYPYTNSTN